MLIQYFHSPSTTLSKILGAEGGRRREAISSTNRLSSSKSGHDLDKFPARIVLFPNVLYPYNPVRAITTIKVKRNNVLPMHVGQRRCILFVCPQPGHRQNDCMSFKAF